MATRCLSTELMNEMMLSRNSDGSTSASMRLRALNTEKFDRVVSHDDVGGDIRSDAASALDEHPVGDPAIFMDNHAGREDGALPYHGVACESDAVAKHTASFQH